MAKRHMLTEDYASLFLRLEELVLANSGEDEFEEIFKLIYAKLLDEIEYDATQFHCYASPLETFRAISSLLSEAVERWPGVFEPDSQIRLTPEHLSVCVEVLEARSIFETGLEVMDAAFEYLTSHTAKGAKGQYFTPRHVVEFCVRMLDPKPGEIVADPACGSGAFLVHAVRHMVPELTDRNSFREVQRSGLKKFCSDHIWGFDFEQRATKVAKALMLLLGDGSSNIIRLNSLLKPKTQTMLFGKAGNDRGVLTVEDVMRLGRPGFKGFDVILTNPPFAGEVRESEVLSEYELYHLMRGRRIERDALFLERCVELLKPGGRLAIVLPDNKLGSEMWTPLREWLIAQAKIMAIVSLPRTVFMPHTSQKTSILFAEKRASKEKPDLAESVVFGISERGGKDSRGALVYRSKGDRNGMSAWFSLDHDLDEMVQTYRTTASSSRRET